jgi:hypothetical protein
VERGGSALAIGMEGGSSVDDGLLLRLMMVAGGGAVDAKRVGRHRGKDNEGLVTCLSFIIGKWRHQASLGVTTDKFTGSFI